VISLLINSNRYAFLINNRYREITTKVLVYFNGADKAPVTLTQDDYIINHSLLEEVQAESDNLLGNVSCNEFNFCIRNKNNMFNPKNSNSPYFGKINQGLKVKPFFIIKDNGNEPLQVPLGEFFVDDWKALDTVCNITCYDRLNILGEMRTPQIPVQSNITYYELYVLLFESLGLSPTEYVVDPLLTSKVAYGWLPGPKVKNALQLLSVASMSLVYMDRLGKVRVLGMFSTTRSVATTLTDDDQIISVANPQSYKDTFSSIELTYYIPTVKPEKEQILKVDNLKIENGRIILNRLALGDTPVMAITNLTLLGAKTTRISDYTLGAFDITIELENFGGTTEYVALEIYGYKLNLLQTIYSCTGDFQYTDKVYTLKSQLIQDVNLATEYGAKLLILVNDISPRVSGILRGNPAIELADLLVINSTYSALSNLKIMPTRFSYQYDGSLSCSFEGIKVDNRLIPTWYYVGPGLYIKGE
jgi:hypothetical protein